MLTTDQLTGISGCTVVDRDGTTCGTAGTAYVDDRTDQVKWITVMLPAREGELLAPADSAEMHGGEIRLGCTLDELSSAPMMDAGEMISPAHEGRLLEHYGLVGTMGAGEMSQSPTTGPGASEELPSTRPSTSPITGTGPHDAMPADQAMPVYDAPTAREEMMETGYLRRYEPPL